MGHERRLENKNLKFGRGLNSAVITAELTELCRTGTWSLEQNSDGDRLFSVCWQNNQTQLKGF